MIKFNKLLESEEKVEYAPNKWNVMQIHYNGKEPIDKGNTGTFIWALFQISDNEYKLVTDSKSEKGNLDSANLRVYPHPLIDKPGKSARIQAYDIVGA